MRPGPSVRARVFLRSAAAALVLALPLAGALSADAGAAAEVSVALASEPDGEAGVLSITIPASATGTSIPVFLRNLLPSMASDLRIYASATRVAGGSLADESAVTISFPAAEDGLVDLGPRDEIAGVLSLEGLTSPGTYTAVVYLDHDGVDQQRIAEVTIEKRASLEFTLEGTGSDGLQVSERTGTFLRSLDNIYDSTQEATVLITLGQVIGPDGTPTDAELLVDCSVASNPVEVAALGRVPLWFRIETPVSGDYLATLEILQAPERITIPIKITRGREEPSVEMDGPATSPVELVGSGSTDVTVVIHETEGRSLSLALPTTFVTRDVDGSPAGVPVHLGAVSTEPATAIHPDDDGAPATCESAAEGSASDDEPAGGDGQPRIVIPPAGSVTVRAPLTGIEDPGTYQGSLRFDVTDATPIKVDFDFKVRRWWGIAAGLIAVGIAVGAFLRVLANRVLPQLKLTSRLASASQRILKQSRRQNLGDENREILADIRGRIREVAEVLRSWSWASAQAEVDAIERQAIEFPTLLEVRRLHGQVADPGPFAVRVNAVKAAFRARVLSPADVAAFEDIRQLRTDLADARPAPAMAGVGAPAGPGLPAPSAINVKIQVVTVLTWLVLAVLGTFLGVQVLWSPNDVWGEAPDLVAALLWGAGVWAAAGQPFGGTDALLKTIQGGA